MKYIRKKSKLNVCPTDTRRVDSCEDFLMCDICGKVLEKAEFKICREWHVRQCHVCQKKENIKRYSKKKTPPKKPLNRVFQNCDKANTCVYGSVIMGTCRIKYQNPIDCKKYDEFLGYNIPVGHERF